MQGYERNYVDLIIKAGLSAYVGIRTTPVAELIGFVKSGKKENDTLGMDWVAETRIREDVMNYDSKIILVTEEAEPKRTDFPPYVNRDSRGKTVICDPIDRSSPMKKLVIELEKLFPGTTISGLPEDFDLIKFWETNIAEAPVKITGGTTALTCLIGGKTLASVVINHIAENIVIAVPAGIYEYSLKRPIDEIESIDMKTIVKGKKQVYFPASKDSCPKIADMKKFVAFAKKSGYPENLRDSLIYFDDFLNHLHHDNPGGPSRTLYLSNFQKGHGSVGSIISNGEKITEWIHWLPVVKYAKDVNGNPALRVFEVALEKPHQKGDVLMSCCSTYSIFVQRENESLIDISFLRRFDKSSHYRAMLVVVPSDNRVVIDAMNKHCFREISDCL